MSEVTGTRHLPVIRGVTSATFAKVRLAADRAFSHSEGAGDGLGDGQVTGTRHLLFALDKLNTARGDRGDGFSKKLAPRARVTRDARTSWGLFVRTTRHPVTQSKNKGLAS